MIPIRDHNPSSKQAIVVPVLIALNAIAFLFIQPTFGGGTPTQRVFEQTRFTACNAAIPYEVMRGELVTEAFPSVREAGQAGVIAALQDGTLGEQPCQNKSIWLSIFASMFFHGGWGHILFNMLFLLIFGNNVEDRLGRGRFLLFYLLAGIGATYAQAFVTPDSTIPLIGASGAIAGVLGAYAIMFPRARVTTLVFFFFITVIELPAVVLLGIWFLLQLTPALQSFGRVAGDVGGVAYMAHVGGFVAGALLLLILRPRRRPSQPSPFL